MVDQATLAEQQAELAEQREQIARYQQFLFWDLIVCVVVGSFYGVIFLIFRHLLAGVVSATCFGVVAILLVARHYLSRQQLGIAVNLTVVALLLGSVVVVAAQPDLFPAVALVPLLALAVALPYMRGRGMALIMVASWLIAVVVVAMGVMLEAPALPYKNALLIGSFAPVVGLILLLLWQFSRRLNLSLEEVRAGRAALESQVQERTRELSDALDTATGLREAERAGKQQLERLVEELRAAKAEADAKTREAQRLQQEELDNRRRLEQAIDTYLAFVQQVARGNLSQRIAVQDNDALGRLGQGLNSMLSSLQAIAQQVREASSNMAAMAAEILAATTQQTAGATQQSAAITQTTTTIEEVKAIAEQTAERAARVAEDSQSALRVAREGTASVEQTVAGMGSIQERVQSIAETILELSEQTQAIGTIIQTVNELADQSNLLALNAAIEAARAGEQGKSFAVVAQHVRQLAERSKGSTGQVREILSEIQEATNKAVLVTEEGSKGVEVGARLANQAGHVIHRIAEEVETSAQANVQMAAAAQQQTIGMEQISQAMTTIQQATNQTLASTRQAERAVQSLNQLAQSLQRAISVYQLDG